MPLHDAQYDNDGNIISGDLVAAAGQRYPIINGIPRFVDFVPSKTVESFGDEWNYFNFTDFKENWLKHTVAKTFDGFGWHDFQHHKSNDEIRASKSNAA